MKCLHPLTIRNPHYKQYAETAKKVVGTYGRNFDNVYCSMVLHDCPNAEPILEVPCGKCEACLVRRTNEWSFRLFQERKHSKNCFFITLTYDDYNVPRDKQTGALSLNKRDCQLFLKRLRKRYGNGIRYFLASEYGENFARPHYHLLLFNLPVDTNSLDWQAKLDLEIYALWQKGNVKCDIGVDGRVIYCAKYMLSTLDPDAWLDRPKPFILTSRKPGLGYGFYDNDAEQRYRYETCDTKCVTEKGIAFPMARYYKDKFFDDNCKDIIKERLKEEYKEPTYNEKVAYARKIRLNFKKQKKL